MNEATDSCGYPRADLGRRNSKCLVCAKDNEGTSMATAERMRRQVISDAIRERARYQGGFYSKSHF